MRRATRNALAPGIGAATLVLSAATAPAQSAAGVETGPPSTWRFSLSADGTWYDNPYFTSAPAVTSWSTSGQAALSRQHRFRTGSFTLSGFGGALYYPELDDFTQPTYGGDLALSLAPSPRTRFSLAQSYQRSNTRYLRALDVEALPLPTSSLENATTLVSLQQQLSRRWQLALNGSFTWRRYDDEQLQGGEQAYGAVQLGHSLGKRTVLSAAYAYSSSWFDEGKARAHQALAGVRRQPDRGSPGYELAGGVGYLESTKAWYPSGRASLTASGRRASFTIGYLRDFGEAFGYGRQMIGDLASAALTFTPSRGVSFSAGYNFGYRRDPADEAYTIRSHVASVGFGWEVLKGLSFGGGYSWDRNETVGFPDVSGQRATASLSYGVNWR